MKRPQKIQNHLMISSVGFKVSLLFSKLEHSFSMSFSRCRLSSMLYISMCIDKVDTSTFCAVIASGIMQSRTGVQKVSKDFKRFQATAKVDYLLRSDHMVLQIEHTAIRHVFLKRCTEHPLSNTHYNHPSFRSLAFRFDKSSFGICNVRLPCAQPQKQLPSSNILANSACLAAFNLKV